jgi:hypothetical protein
VPHAEIVGLYPVEQDDSCYLIEVVLRDATGPPDFCDFTQPLEGVDRAEWQVPYDEKLLDAAGETVIADLFSTQPSYWPAIARVAFYFHDLRLSEPMQSPFGDLVLPAPSERPSRLSALNYERP